ncbi:collagenase-like [Anopheles moucheti]|uniref:collagenase-like n=1 Tax=Anopheles moucheti TaxID=186751 RepID=UPI0022F0EF0F|nr:collagenase-like [Anopheles moucheti]
MHTLQVIVLSLYCFAVIQAAKIISSPDDIDWSTVRSIREKPGYAPVEQTSNRSERILNGITVARGDIPYAAAILISEEFATYFCGGALVSEHFVLTAATCVDGDRDLSITVLLDAAQINTAGEFIAVSETIVHPAPSDHNIALLRLNRAVRLNDNIRPVTLPNRRQRTMTFVNQLASISGWGRTASNTNEALPLNNLRVVRNHVMSNFNCGVSFPFQISDQHICITGDSGSACAGDEGGPLTTVDVVTGRTFLIGLYSFTSFLGCGMGRPTVHTRITEYLDWIEANSDVIILDNWNTRVV